MKRSAVRLTLQAEVGIRRSGLHAFRVRIFDASPQGCKIEFVERPNVGERIWIKFDGLEAIEATVRWIEEHACGVHFNRPLHDAVFRRIAASAAPPSDQGRPCPMRPMRAVFRTHADETPGLYSVSEWWLEARTFGPGKHRHPDDHAYYVIEGTLSLRLNGEWSQLSEGSYAIVPGGTDHDFANHGTERAGFLTFNLPVGFEAGMDGIQAALASNELREFARPL